MPGPRCRAPARGPALSRPPRPFVLAPVLALAALTGVAAEASPARAPEPPPSPDPAARPASPGAGAGMRPNEAGAVAPMRPDEASAVVPFRLRMPAPPPRPAPVRRAARSARRGTAAPSYVRPVRSYVLSSQFGARWGRRHAGVDLAAPVGTPVSAVEDGVVVTAGREAGYGRLVAIRGGNGVVTAYAHLSAIRVHKGQRVRAGTIIGRVGSTGRATGPHLHFEVRVSDSPVDPVPWLRHRRVPI